MKALLELHFVTIKALLELALQQLLPIMGLQQLLKQELYQPFTS